MGLIGGLGCINNYSKKQCRSLFWRVKKAVRKHGGGGKKKHHLKFQYDPSSYALNFDDGGRYEAAVKLGNNNNQQLGNNVVWIYIAWVE